jgi:regulator of ribonuclease activity A
MAGQRLNDVTVKFSGVTIHPGDWIYADEDGVIISKQSLSVKRGLDNEA